MSNINFQAIDENFPVPGQDNDTQTFRDNFDTIKKSLRAAKEEIEELQDPTTGVARLDRENNFDLNIISNAVFENTRKLVVPKNTINLDNITDDIPVDYQSGSYHIFEFTGDGNITLDLKNLPGDDRLTVDFEDLPGGPPRGTVGKMTIELYSGAGSKTVDFAVSGPTSIKKNFSEPLTIDSPVNPVIIEVWRYEKDTVFVRNLGQFS